MFKFLCLFAVLAAASAEIITPYSYGAYPYGAYPYGAYPYSAYPYGAYPYSAYPATYPAATVAAPSLPPHHPATVVGPTGHPLDTPEVNVAKALHYQAKALNAHGIHKRAIVAPVAPLAYSAPYVGAYPYSAVAPYSAPYSYSSQYSQIVHPY